MMNIIVNFLFHKGTYYNRNIFGVKTPTDQKYENYGDLMCNKNQSGYMPKWFIVFPTPRPK